MRFSGRLYAGEFYEACQGHYQRRGVPVVYDSIGKDTFTGSLDCLAPLGMLVSFGNASGPIPPVDSSELVGRGSLFFTRPTLFSYIARRSDLEAMTGELFDMLVSGRIKASVNQTYPLAEVGRRTPISKGGARPVRPCCCRRQSFFRHFPDFYVQTGVSPPLRGAPAGQAENRSKNQ